MARALYLGALVALFGRTLHALTLDKVWQLPKTYEMAAVLHMPYIPFSEPLIVFYDANYQGGTMKVQHWGGSTTTITAQSGHSYVVVPEMDGLVCRNATTCRNAAGTHFAPCSKLGAVPHGKAVHPIPQSLHLFKKTGNVVPLRRCRRYANNWGKAHPITHGGAFTSDPRPCAEYYDKRPIPAEEWVFASTWDPAAVPGAPGGGLQENGELYVGQYVMYTDPADHTPLRLRQLGHNIPMASSHPDEYTFDYFYIRAVPIIDQEIFSPPLAAMRCTPRPKATSGSLSAGAVHEAQEDWHLLMPEGHPTRLEKFRDYSDAHGKHHRDPQTRARKFHHYHRTHRYVQAFNRQDSSYKLAVNHMADWTPEERAQLRGVRWTAAATQRFLRAVDDEARLQKRRQHEHHTRDPYEVDWRRRHALRWGNDEDWDPRSRGFFVTPPKDQGTCGSCWAFGLAGTLEGQIANITHNDERGEQYPEPVAEQNLMDCSWGFGNKACGGGMDFNGYDWIIRNNHGRIASMRSYGPYMNENSWCHYDLKQKLTRPFTLQGTTYQAEGIGRLVAWGTTAVYDCSPNCDALKRVRRGQVIHRHDTAASVAALKRKLWQLGPITVNIDASPDDFYYYSEGIYDQPRCSTFESDHSVTLVGYGKDATGRAYWLIKNSWGALFGERGYIKIAMEGNVCGVATAPTYAVMEEP